MNIIEITEGTITIELQPEEAMDIARACGRVLELETPLTEANDHEYRLYRATFQALAVAAHSHYCIINDDDLASASLSALRATPHRPGKR